MNAREEFIKHIGGRKVLCVQIQYGEDYSDDDKPGVFNLTTGWNSEDWNRFLSDIDFEYDSGYGGQNLFGTIWYEDSTWSERGEYDGSEWWDYHICPNIPAELDRKDKVREQKLNQIL
jgi:hypothetical protein